MNRTIRKIFIVILIILILVVLGYFIFEIEKENKIGSILIISLLVDVLFLTGLLLYIFDRIYLSLSVVSIGLIISVYQLVNTDKNSFPLSVIIYFLCYIYLIYVKIKNRRGGNVLVSDALKNIKELYNGGKYEEAIKSLHKIKRNSIKKNFEVYWWSGLLEYKIGNCKKAIKFYNEAENLSGSNNPEIKFQLAQAQYCIGDFKPAIERFRWCIDQGYRDLGAKVNIAASLFCLGKYNDANNHLDKYVLRSSDFNSYYLLGLIQEGLGNISEARKSYEISMNKQGGNCKIFARIAVILIDDGNGAKAKEVLERCTINKRTTIEYEQAIKYLSKNDNKRDNLPWILKSAETWSQKDRRTWANF